MNSRPENLLSFEFETDLKNPLLKEIQWELTRKG